MKKNWSLLIACILFIASRVAELANITLPIQYGEYFSLALVVLAGIVLALYLFVQQKIVKKFKELVVKWNVFQIILFFVFLAANVYLLFFSPVFGGVNIVDLILFLSVNYLVIALFLQPKK